ncbi:MAG TPA: nicotinamide-nucleotide adenylyltransferase [Thermoplasmatales archaeon]|nr:nicotinamide-nucleotide adenylyltransferase [Thermoplasmatales archaeon]
MIALFIGRFQPFHNGHLEAIKRFSKEFDKIVIGIGSSQYSYTKENPFTAEEREMMIRKTLENLGIKNIEIYFIPDIHNYSRWVEHVESMVPKFDIVLARNPITLRLFKEKGYKVKRIPLFGGKNCHGKIIRKLIAEGKDWRSLVPKEVAEIIEKIDGESRVKRLYMD